MHWTRRIAALCLFALSASTVMAGSLPAGFRAPSLTIPTRQAEAPTGSQIVDRLRSLAPDQRREELKEQVLEGNVPGFLHHLAPVDLTSADRKGRTHHLRFWVLPDYLAVGSNEDFVRVPLGLDEALDIAGRLGSLLPTPRMVDAIYQQAAFKLAPQPLPAGPQMTSVDYFWRHNRMIENQLGCAAPGGLVAGIKKDVVLTPRLLSHPGRVAIYGWHRMNGRPIQPLSTVHGHEYADYSHGIRLVNDTVLLDGQPRSLLELLADPNLSACLTEGGPYRAAPTHLAAR